jgi:hypothetical protein
MQIMRSSILLKLLLLYLFLKLLQLVLLLLLLVQVSNLISKINTNRLLLLREVLLSLLIIKLFL